MDLIWLFNAAIHMLDKLNSHLHNLHIALVSSPFASSIHLNSASKSHSFLNYVCSLDIIISKLGRKGLSKALNFDSLGLHNKHSMTYQGHIYTSAKLTLWNKKYPKNTFNTELNLIKLYMRCQKRKCQKQIQTDISSSYY